MRQFWFSASLLRLLLAYIFCQNTGDGHEQQEHGHVALLHGCPWDEEESLRFPRASLLLVLRCSRRHRRGQVCSWVSQLTAPGGGSRECKGRERFALQRVMKDLAAFCCVPAIDLWSS